MIIKKNSHLLFFLSIGIFISILVMSLVSSAYYSFNKREIEEAPSEERVYFIYKMYDQQISSKIEEWDLADTKVDDNLINYLKSLPNVKKVLFGDQEIDVELLKELKETYPNIDFEYKVIINNTQYDSSVEKLDLQKMKVTDLKLLANKLKLLPNLKYVDLSNCSLSNEELAYLRELVPGVEIHWIIHMGKWSLKTDVTSFSVLIYHFDYERLKSDDIKVLKYCTHLQALDLGHQAITDISVIGKYLTKLRILILADNKISDISPLASLKHLHYIELFMNNIEDISILKQLPELVDVNLCYLWKITDFSPLYELPLVERVWLVGTKANNTVINNIKLNSPNVKVVNTGSGSTNSGWRTHERYWEMIKMYRNPYYLSSSFTKYDGVKGYSLN